MPKENRFSRRDSLKTIAAGTALVGGSTLVPSTLADEQTENEAETDAETDTESETDGETENETDVDPNAIELIAACVDDGRQFATFRVDNGNDVTVTLTADGAPVLGHGASEGEYGAEPIERINAILSDFNERLENVENVETIDEITDDTADELRSEILTQIVAEINVQSQEILGEDLADDVSTPDEARAEAQKIKEEYGVAAQEAVDALNEAADAVEAIRAALGDAADTLRGDGNESANGEGDANDGESDESADEADGGLTVDADASLEMRVGLDSDGTATVSLYHEDEEVATETADVDTLPGCGC